MHSDTEKIKEGFDVVEAYLPMYLVGCRKSMTFSDTEKMKEGSDIKAYLPVY